jgi:ABC-type Zn uptake system ZnuABC Zn-binding protein ZnuA
MKYLVPLIIVLLLLSACKTPKANDVPERPLILSTIYPYELLIRQMVGDAAEVRSLIPPNASVHSFSPKPSDLTDLHRADLIVSNGLGLEAVFAQNLAAMTDKHIISSEMLKDLVALDSLNQVRDQLIHHHHHHHDDEEHEHLHIGADPHLWTSPTMLIKLSMKLKNELIERFPDMAPLINHNYAEIHAQLTAVHETILEERAQYAAPALVTYHNSFHYFCNDYSINYLGWVQSSPGREPGARELAELGRKIQDHGVKAIFIEPQQNPKSAEVLAREYGIELLSLDPLGASLGVNTVAEFIMANWQTMKQAF